MQEISGVPFGLILCIMVDNLQKKISRKSKEYPFLEIQVFCYCFGGE